MKIDAHQHFWSLNRTNDYNFLTPSAGILYNNYLPEKLGSCLQSNGIDYTILVQAAETQEETIWLMEITKDVDYVAGIVGWIDFDTNLNTFIKSLNALQKNRKFVGIRPMLQDLSDDRFILRKRVLENMKKVAELDIPFEFLIYPKHLPYVYEVLHKVSGLRAVIDHLGKPDIRNQDMDSWFFWMNKIGKFSNVYCKLSGMVTEANLKNWKQADFEPYVNSVIDSFGVDRLMYGSDWPVCLQAATYSQVYHLLQDILRKSPEKLSDSENKLIFGKNAENFYKLKLNNK